MDKSSLAISPTAKNVNLTRGETYDSSIEVINNNASTETLHYQINVVPYGVFGENYLVDLSGVTAYTKIIDWITIDEPEGEVAPGSTKIVNYHINVPANAKDGGQYCALAVQNIPKETEKENSASLSNVMEISSLIYAKLGDSFYAGQVLETKIQGFSLGNKVSSSIKLQNTGNIHQNARITTKAYSAFTGRQISLTSESYSDPKYQDLAIDDFIAEHGADYYSEVIMPETTRQIFHEFSDLPQIGAFNFVQEVSFNGKVETFEHSVIIFPIWAIMILVFLFGAVVFAIIYFIRGYKKAKPRRNRF